MGVPEASSTQFVCKAHALALKRASALSMHPPSRRCTRRTHEMAVGRSDRHRRRTRPPLSGQSCCASLGAIDRMAQTLVIAGSGKAPAALHFYDLLENYGLLIHSQGMLL